MYFLVFLSLEEHGDTRLMIHASHVTKSYGTLTALDAFGFSVAAGTCTGLLGPNGAGKSTMMKIIYGKSQRDDPSSSTVDVMGFDPARDQLEIKYRSGVVSQDNNLDEELNVVQNLRIYARFFALSRKEADRRIDDLLDMMELKKKKHEKIRRLSGGMKRRLTIARGLINTPTLLILDEPTTGLDPQVRHLIWHRIRSLKKQGMTILLTTHYMDEAYQLCDRITIMDKGRAILEGVPHRLIRENLERYVVEITHRDAQKLVQDMDSSTLPRHETYGGVTYLYSNEYSQLSRVTGQLPEGGFFTREANLEDLFLTVTGRSLHDAQ
jgi:lipooligosaccharide transport system ATP-binding protein